MLNNFCKENSCVLLTSSFAPAVSALLKSIAVTRMKEIYHTNPNNKLIQRCRNKPKHALPPTLSNGFQIAKFAMPTTISKYQWRYDHL
jgi:hypothetical protein